MNKTHLSLIPLFLFAAAAAATTRCVVPPGTPGVATAPGFTSWGTAATNIQHAVDTAETDDIVLVTNGTYRLTSEISIAKKITLRSFKNGTTNRDGTILDGNFPATSNRCLNVNFAGAVVDGFTITNGYAVTGHVSGGFGGGGLKVSKGTVTNCLITGNWTPYNGGVGIQFSQRGYVENCIVYDNNSGGVNWSYDGTGSGSTWTNSCTYPMPTGASVVGMETNAPRFMNAALGDFSLRGSSPCIDKGVYRTWMASAKDLAGNFRIIGAAVDMGAFEAPLPPRTVIVAK
jgi:hypothetical protein